MVEASISEETPKPQLVESDDESRLVDDYEASGGELIGVEIDNAVSSSRRIAAIQEKIRNKRVLARASKKKEVRDITEEIDKIEEVELMPLMDELEIIIWRIVELFEENPVMRKNVQNWVVIPDNLRKMIRKGLILKNVDASEYIERAEHIEQERIQALGLK